MKLPGVRRWLLAAVVITTPVVTTSGAAHAYDVQLQAETLFRAYEVRAPATSTSWERRRLIQEVDLRLTEPLAQEVPGKLTPRLRVVVQLRLSQEVGNTCFVGSERCVDAGDSRSASTYQALAQDGVLDAMLAYAEAVDLPAGVEVRAGRLLWFDPVGFARLDGVNASVAPASWLSFAAVAGVQVRATSVAGTSAFEPPGVLRLKLSEREALLASNVSPPSTTRVLGASLEVGEEQLVRGQVSLRDVQDEDGLVMRRVGLSLRSSPHPSLHLASHAVLDVADLALALGSVHAHWQQEALSIRSSLEVRRPRFDLGSIWAYFPTSTVEQLESGLSAKLSPHAEVGGGLRGRRTKHRALNDTFADDYDAGTFAFTSVRVIGVDLTADGYLWFGDLGDLGGLDVYATRRVGSSLEIQLGTSLQRVNDTASARYDGLSVSEWLRASWGITEHTRAVLELNHAYNGVVAQRFSALASLQVGVWR